MNNESSWIDICAVEDVPVLGSRVVERPGAVDIAIFRNAENEIFALDDYCPHKGGPLSQGIVFGKKVACPLHNWNIELDTGCVVKPDEGCVPTVALKVEGGRIYLDLNKRVIPIQAAIQAATQAAA